LHPLVPRILRGDLRAVARAMTLIENDDPQKRLLLQGLYPHAGRAHLIGITGSPGAGKSSLVDGLIGHLRRSNLKVGVLAVDPSSPFTGGALLGDRVRMTRHSEDSGVYIRSMGSRGTLGGLAKSSREILYVFEAYGCDVVLLETVGVGQAELDVMSVSDTVALVMTPGSGDGVQAAKSGIMEIADIFVVNKCDLPGADSLVRELKLMLMDKRSYRENWEPPIVRTTASDNEGIAELWEALTRHRSHIEEHGYWKTRRKQRHKAETLQLLKGQFSDYVMKRAVWDVRWRRLLEEDTSLDPYEALDELLADLPWLRQQDDTRERRADDKSQD
jgi:LAO/AO transport system kinase